MKRSIGLARLLVLAVLAGVAAWSLAEVAQAGPSAPSVPAEIRPPVGHKVFLEGHAVGVQIYSCNATSAGYRWGFVGPRADLYDDRGKVVLTHFAGPTWRAKYGSRVLGRFVDGVTVDATAIPGLLLSVTATAPGTDGDRLAHTTYVQRVATTGGLAPDASACTESTAGTTDEVPYTADYFFWKAGGVGE